MVKKESIPYQLPLLRQCLALIICAALMTPGILPAAASGEGSRTVKAGVFFFDGYHMKDSDGVYTGYGIELLNKVSQYSHLNFEYVGYDKSWEEMQEMLKRGEIDVVTSARKTRQRMELFAFSAPIERNSTVLSVQENNTDIVSGDYSTYTGMTIGVLSGSSQNQSLAGFAQENGFTYQTREFDGPAALEQALQSGTIDAILTSTLRRSQHEKLLDTIEIDYFYAIARKDDQDIIDEVNYALEQLNLCEGDWTNTLYHKYYGGSVSSDAFTQRELEYIQAVASGQKHITMTATVDRRPYSYVEDGELKGILPDYFDSLMQKAGLPYEIIVPESREEYARLKENGEVDAVADWQQSAAGDPDCGGSGFLTAPCVGTGTSLLTHRNFSGPIHSLAVVEGQEGLPLKHNQFQNARIVPYQHPEDVLRAVLNRETDAAFLRTYTAQYFVNHDAANSLRFNMIDSEQLTFHIYVPAKTDHELVTILNKCIRQTPDDVRSQLILQYTAAEPENVSFAQYLSVHPELALLLVLLAALVVGAVIFCYLRFRWNRKLLQATEQSRQELEEQFAIVNALSWDYLNVYTVDMQRGTVRTVKRDAALTPGNHEERSYPEGLRRYIENRVVEEDRAYLTEALSLERVRQVLSANEEYTGTFRIRVEDEVHNYQFTYVPYQPKGQTAPLALVGFRNIDEIVRKEQAQKAALEDALHMARAASEAKTAFLSSVSHDIRTPMNAIIGFLALMKDEADNPDIVREYIQRIDTASQHLLGLINDVLDMNKIESGNTTLSVSEMDMAKVIEEINAIIRPQARAKQQSFDIFVTHMKYEHLMGDKMRINQILINLLSNAVKYTPEGGAIQLRLEELNQVVDNYSRVRFTVSDNGLGMSEAYQKVIFDPFTREETNKIHEIQGTGLGMAITKSLVDLMGGTIRLESTLGEGSTFTVELELRIQEQEDDPAFWTDHKVGRMIVVDDEEETCRNIVRIMSQAGVQTDWATSGKAAVQMARERREAGQPYDLILLDWQMPDLDGLESARLIRENYSRHIPILLLTAYDWSEIEQEAMEIGINHFMPKPFFMSTFKEAIRRVMGGRRMERGSESEVVKDKRILVVDDIEVNRIILVKILGALGASCDTASSGREAVEKFKAASTGEGGYDLILMDVQMPEMDGYEATRTIRASGLPCAGTVPIIAMTANAFVDDVRDAIDSGMDAHIAKPVQIDKLKATIQQVMDSRAEKTLP